MEELIQLYIYYKEMEEQYFVPFWAGPEREHDYYRQCQYKWLADTVAREIEKSI